MSAQLKIIASHSESTAPAARLNDWPLPGWQVIAPPSVRRYLRLQQSNAHWNARIFDLGTYLAHLKIEQEEGIDHRVRIARVERLIVRTLSRAAAVTAELFVETQRLRDVSEEA